MVLLELVARVLLLKWELELVSLVWPVEPALFLVLELVPVLLSGFQLLVLEREQARALEWAAVRALARGQLRAFAPPFALESR